MIVGLVIFTMPFFNLVNQNVAPEIVRAIIDIMSDILSISCSQFMLARSPKHSRKPFVGGSFGRHSVVSRALIIFSRSVS